MADTPTQSLAGYFTCHVDDVIMTLQGQGRVVLTVTADGRLLLGPGLSMDDATQQAAELLVKHYEAAVRRVAPAGQEPHALLETLQLRTTMLNDAHKEIERLKGVVAAIADFRPAWLAPAQRDIIERARAALEAKP